MVMKSRSLLLALLGLWFTSAFVPQARTSQFRTRLLGADFEKFAPGERELAKRDVRIGKGEPAKEGDVIRIKYKGLLLEDGFQFDAGTFSFQLGEGTVIRGWDQGLLGVRKGGKRILKIPPNLAYGRAGAGALIPPNADLQFECEIKSVASGPIGKAIASLGLGLNFKTIAIAFVASYIFLGGKK
jgi:hypothetical protein|mmetsp:Transcript_22082/g.39796  ORF Transcript_22082/g.39796 Transcript_22082/m.39796 type:complete len:185 (-) Transcript_22082:50-604(-)